MANNDDLPLFSQSSLKKAPTPLTVSELTQQIRSKLEPSFPSVWVQGEVSNVRPAASGHLYFSLKDAGASISVALFGGRRLKFDLRDGMEVICQGKISVYPPRGGYQLIADQLEPVGAGALQLAFEQLKAKLQAEGLFSQDRKKKIPSYPRSVAIVTSPSGAAIRDMITVMNRRARNVRIVVVPALVQGDGAPAQIVRGIELAQQQQLGEVVVLARGGGSMEDLWCFNDERVARAIAASKLPVISAVGHEIDFTISDFVADLRAPTPSAAAEILTGHWYETGRRLLELRDRLRNSMLRSLVQRKTLLQHVAARLVSPKDRLREKMQRCDELSLRLQAAMRVRLERGRNGLERLAGQLNALSPLRVLERGYSLALAAKTGQVIRGLTDAKTHEEIRIRFHDGEARAKILG